MNTIQEQRTIIERLVRLNNKYIGNEDLFEDFCSEAYQRSYTLFDNNEIKNLAAQYNMDEKAVRSALSDDMLDHDISVRKAVELIADSAKQTLEPKEEAND